MFRIIWTILGVVLLNIHNAYYPTVTGAVAVLQLEDDAASYALGKAAANGAFPFQILEYAGWGFVVLGIILVINHFYNQSKGKYLI